MVASHVNEGREVNKHSSWILSTDARTSFCSS